MLARWEWDDNGDLIVRDGDSTVVVRDSEVAEFVAFILDSCDMGDASFPLKPLHDRPKL
jgi:hypothetical protein